MSKGAVIAGVVVVVVVIVGGGALAMASSKPVILPDLAPPPPPPAPPSLGTFIVGQGFDLAKDAYNNPYVKTYTGGEAAAPYIVKNVATGGLYGTAKGIVNVGKKLLGSIF